MHAPPGFIDIFPACSLGGVALVGLMSRIDPPAPVRHGVVATMAAILALYLCDMFHPWLPERLAVPAYVGLVATAGMVIVWNWMTHRISRRR